MGEAGLHKPYAQLAQEVLEYLMEKEKRNHTLVSDIRKPVTMLFNRLKLNPDDFEETSTLKKTYESFLHCNPVPDTAKYNVAREKVRSLRLERVQSKR